MICCRVAAVPLVAVALSLFPVAEAGAQAQSAVEVWGAFSGVVEAPAGTLVSLYAPPLVNGTAVASSGGQTLALVGRRGPGLQGGVNLFPSRHVGLQFFIDYAGVDLSGANGPYLVSLQYVSAQPPDNVPRVFTVQSSTAWPDTTGSLTQVTLGFNAIARTREARRVSASVSGGLGWYRIDGTAQPLGYTDYHLGGHSVLFSDETHLAFALEATSRFGVNVGGDLRVSLARHAAIVAGYRYLGAPAIDVPVFLTRITNADQVLFSTTVEEIARQLLVAPARFRPSGSRLIVGLKITP